MSETKKIRYIDKDEMHLVVASGNPVIIKKGEVKEFSIDEANGFLRDTKTVITGYKDKAKTQPIIKIIPKWEEVTKKEAK